MSQLYARVFLSILDSSLAEDWQTRHVFEDFLKLADEHGVVDMTREALSRRTNVPPDILARAIDVLEGPDPKSRDPEQNGRRIVRLDGHRDWGWMIVNWQKYEAVRSGVDSKLKTRERVRRFREKRADQFPLPLTPPVHVQHQHQIGPLQNVTAQLQHKGKFSYPDDFEQFWSVYPKKKDKLSALQAWMKTDKPELNAVIAAVAAQKKTEDWQKADGKYIPFPATWINGRRWEDDVTISVTARKPF